MIVRPDGELWGEKYHSLLSCNIQAFDCSNGVQLFPHIHKINASAHFSWHVLVPIVPTNICNSAFRSHDCKE
jgi:hypothetical protein